MPLDSSSGHNADDSDSDFVETDPSGRYGRYTEVLGQGACKKSTGSNDAAEGYTEINWESLVRVKQRQDEQDSLTRYRAFDELEGIEVAWNQIKFSDFLKNPEELERLYSEVHSLKTLKHKNIITFYNSWVDTKNEHINFITEVFTSGTLRQYRKKHKHVDLQAMKKWSKQILEGLLYLHSHDPPIIHRDLKCDNIFVNGNHGEVKIGDLGLATILRQAHSAHSVIGTPEFMAPELYEEDYNELVDIYAFGMCLLELVTFDYPYMKCANAAQIYKKVTSGVKPASLAKVDDPEVKSFIEKCIAKVSDRLTAKDLLMDPFLHGNDNDENIYLQSKPNPYPYQDDDTENSYTAPDFTVEGQMRDTNTVFLKLCMEDATGHVRTIHFPFDIKLDTPTDVAKEMVQELDLTHQDISSIAQMIESEIGSIFPDWSVTYQKLNQVGSDGEDQGSSHGGSRLEPVCFDGEDQGSSHDVDIIVEKLEHIMMEQKKEVDELKKQNGLVVYDILMKLPSETRKEIMSSYKLEILKACVLDFNHTDFDPILRKAEETHTVVCNEEKQPAAENCNTKNIFKYKFKTGIDYTMPNKGIAVILNDSSGS